MSIILIAGNGEPANTHKNGLWELLLTFTRELPNQQIIRLAHDDEVFSIEEPAFIAAHSFGAELAIGLAQLAKSSVYLALCDGVMESQWWNPFRPDYVMPYRVVEARSWNRVALMPPFSSKIVIEDRDNGGRDFQNKTVPWVGHNTLIAKIIPEVIEFAKVTTYLTHQ